MTLSESEEHPDAVTRWLTSWQLQYIAGVVALLTVIGISLFIPSADYLIPIGTVEGLLLLSYAIYRRPKQTEWVQP